MKLTLTVLASQPGNAPRGTSRTVQGGTISIGRGAGCDWILPDPLSHLSKRHCIIAASATGFVVTDTSTNGVFINEAEEALGNGTSAALGDGDRLTLGDYVLKARIAASEPQAQRAPLLNEDDDPFGIGDLIAKRPPEPAPELPPLPPQQDDAFLSPFAAPLAGEQLPGAIIPEDVAWLHEEPLLAPRLPAAEPIADESLLARSDHVAGHNAAFVPPAVEGGGIPDDWWGDDEASPNPASLAPPAAPPPAQPRRAPVVAAPMSAAPGDLLAHFLEGAGLRPDALQGQDPAAVLRALGEAYRIAVLGVAEILRTRAVIKSEFRIEQTKIGGIGNSPLKFLEDADAVLAAMVGAPSPGYQEARLALREGLRDVKAHQLAMVIAIQAALKALLAQLDPEALKARLERRSLFDAVLPGARKARYWEAFEESYKSIAAELEEDFNGVFGRAFAVAYEEGMRRR
jgi:type VI secretion system protein